MSSEKGDRRAEIARLEQAANERPRLSGFSDERGLQVRERSSVWAEVEDAQNRIWGIQAQTEANRQAWRDRMATLLDLVERAVSPLTDHKSRMGISDKDMKVRVLRHRSAASFADPANGIPHVSLEYGVIQFVDLAIVDIRPVNFTTAQFIFQPDPTLGGPGPGILDIIWGEEGWGSAERPADKVFIGFVTDCVRQAESRRQS